MHVLQTLWNSLVGFFVHFFYRDVMLTPCFSIPGFGNNLAECMAVLCEGPQICFIPEVLAYIKIFVCCLCTWR